MKRVLEPEVMDDEESVKAYAMADFSTVNSAFVDEVIDAFGRQLGNVADLGCGPGFISGLLAISAPESWVTGIDASKMMLEHAVDRTEGRGVRNLEFILGRIPGVPVPDSSFDTIVSNSLVHHLPNPDEFWQEVRRLGKPDAAVYVKDLLRPETREQAAELVRQYAGNEPEIHQTDFYNSLLASFTVEEIDEQLQRNGVGHLKAQQVSDRHWVVSGRL